MQVLNDLVIVRVVLEPAAGINRTGHTQAIQLAHEVRGGVVLVFGWQFRSLGQGGVENHRVGLSN